MADYLSRKAEQSNHFLKISKFKKLFPCLPQNRIIALDECGFHLNETPRYGYSYKSFRANYRKPSYPGGMKTENFHRFLTNLKLPISEKYHLIMDNLPVHKSKQSCIKLKLTPIKELLASKNIEVLFLPPYTPEMNPVECCFNLIRQWVEKRKPRTYEKLKLEIDKIINILNEKDLTEYFRHCRDYNFNGEEVLKLEKKEKNFIVKTGEGNNFTSRAIVIASGAVEKELGIEGEKKFTNLGVSYCAICDGFLFRNQEVAVVGGGYSALETALYMSNVAKKVYFIHRRSEFRAEPEIVIQTQNNPKIIFLLNSVLTEIQGSEAVEKVLVSNLANNEKSELLVKAVFPCIGLAPFSSFAHKLGVCDRENYVAIKDDCSTAVSGLFAAGDVARATPNKIKQIVTAVAEGAIAAQSVIKYLKK
ncbi:9397_t:CDS:2 [Cetraspora pellucida]|uniref:9397_t:CDS:1 n=1 Tax=Cetraspora pellucida TaxID=1433469 RepID=A0ACA9MZA8_9GLOM|nr:9397_t:CDS:2 [Cetraspora pellucida]